MKILLVSGTLPPFPCGVGDYVDQLARALATLPGNQVAVLTGASDEAISAVAQPYRLFTVPSWQMRDAGSAIRILRQWQPDVVHVQHPSRGYGGGWLPSFIAPMAMLAGARVVRTWHEPLTIRNALRTVVQLLAPGPYLVVRPEFEAHTWAPLRPLLRVRQRGLVEGASAIPTSTLDEMALDALRQGWLGDGRRLIAFFGFLLPAKGVERLFKVADPATDRLIIVGDTTIDPAYAARIRNLAAADPWRGLATVTGTRPAEDVADILAAVDGVVLPFLDGGGPWNSSIHAATAQGTPVVTTHAPGTAMSKDPLVDQVEVGDDVGLREAAAALPAWRPRRVGQHGDRWDRLAREHMFYYRGMPEAQKD